MKSSYFSFAFFITFFITLMIGLYQLLVASLRYEIIILLFIQSILSVISVIKNKSSKAK